MLSKQGVKLFTKLGFDSGEKLRQAFKEATFNKDFDDLKIPFACTAVDLITGRVVVLNKEKSTKQCMQLALLPRF